MHDYTRLCCLETPNTDSPVPAVNTFPLAEAAFPDRLPAVAGHVIGVGWNQGPFGMRILIFCRLLRDLGARLGASGGGR
jgi:hypothetical protein